MNHHNANDKNINFKQSFLEERLESERFLLVPISMKYRDAIFREFSNDIIPFMYLAPAKEIGETEEFIKNSLKGLRGGNDF
jgi:hypothetical protein